MALPGGTDYDLATVTNPGSALTDFTLIVDLSNCSADFKSNWNTNSNGYGRAAIHGSGTELACDWIDLDYSSGTGLVRVKWSGTLASSGTQQLRLYPPNTGNSQYAAADTYGSDNAYDSYWEGYYPDGGETDRTSNSNDGTGQGGVIPGGATGKIGAGTDFDGSDDYIDITYSPTASTDYTFLIWAEADSIRQQWIISADILPNGWGLGCYDANGVLRAYSGSASNRWIGNNGDCTTDFQYWAMKYDYTSGVDSILRNGSALTPSSNNSTTPITDATDIKIGGNPGYWVNFDGILCEVQVHSTLRSADWVAEEYSQTNDNASFFTTWTWQGSAGNPNYYYENQMGGAA